MGNSKKLSNYPTLGFPVRVTKVLDYGIQVETVDDQRAGFVKRREITWERRISVPIKIPEVGSIVEAVNLPKEQLYH